MVPEIIPLIFVQAIINKALPKSLSHITAKSLVDLKLTENPSFKERSKSTANQGNFQTLDASPFVCPVTGLEANGIAKFVVLRRCGTVVAEKAMKQVRRFPLVSPSSSLLQVKILDSPPIPSPLTRLSPLLAAASAENMLPPSLL